MSLPARLISLAVLALTASSASAATPPSFAQNYGVDNYDGSGKLYDDPYYGSGFDYPVAMAKMADGGFVVAGQIDSPEMYRTVTGHTSARSTGALVRFAGDGSILWQVAIRETNDRYDSFGNFYPGVTTLSQVATDAQGNIFVTGGKGNTNNGGQAPFVAKFSPAGQMLWQKGILKGSALAGAPAQQYDLAVLSGNGTISATTDGGLVFAGQQSLPGQNRYVPLLVKFNGDGSIGFYKAFEPGPAYGTVSACQSHDGTRYVMAFNYPNNFNHMLLVTDANGDLISQRGYAPGGYTGESAVAIIGTADGGFASLTQNGNVPNTGVLRKFT
ncbi:MAG TPA: hypothetical protein VGC85_08110, partial [Chthoniobacterales bacterium]